MRKATPSGITPLYNQIRSRAAATRQVRSIDLKNGARMAIRVKPVDGGEQITLSFARKKTKLGTTEEIVFKRDCNVPAHAERIPADPSLQELKMVEGEAWNLVAYRWVEAHHVAAAD